MLKALDLRRQFDLIRDRQRTLQADSDQDLFPIWVLLALASPNERIVAESLCGGPHDGEMDAVLIDSGAVWIVQGKLRAKPGAKVEAAKDLNRFVDIARHLYAPESDPQRIDFRRRITLNARGALEKFKKASRETRDRAAKLHLVFASTGRVSPHVSAAAQKRLRATAKHATLTVLDHRQIGQILTNYIRDVAPAVPSLRLRVVGGELRPNAMGDSRMLAWTIATTASDVAALFRQGGEQIFARNIRHGLGDKVDVNKAIRATLLKHPERFWFLNNGLTIACESARLENDEIVMSGAQVINGQQTTRSIVSTLDDGPTRGKAGKAHVAARIISFEGIATEQADELIARVVEATNLQNAISKADLRSNDIAQIELSRALASRGYHFIRKRGRHDSPFGLNFLKRKVRREELFSAAAGTRFASVALRKGRTPLFDPDQPYYSFVTQLPVIRVLLAWHLWRRVNSLAWGSSDRQGSKYLAHFVCHREIIQPLRGDSARLLDRIEKKDEEVARLLDRACEAVFKAALRAFRRNRSFEGKPLLPKQYHQREDSDRYFERMWKSPESRSNRRVVADAVRELRSLVRKPHD